MTTRFCLAVITAFSPTVNLFAHDGDHSGMADLLVTLHNVALPFAAVVIALAISVFARKLRNGSSRT